MLNHAFEETSGPTCETAWSGQFISTPTWRTETLIAALPLYARATILARVTLTRGLVWAEKQVTLQ